MTSNKPPHHLEDQLANTIERFKEDIWGKLTEIKVPHLHDQHCRLVEYLIDVFEIMERLKLDKVSQAEKEQLGEVLDHIQDYVVLHLREEEAFMDRIKFPGSAKHKISHDKFTNKFLEIRAHIEKAGIGHVNDLFFFIYSWLFEHINSQDTIYSEFYVQMPLAKDFPSKDHLLDTIMASAADGIVIIDDKGVIITFNAAAEVLFNYDAAEMIGQNISTLMPSPHCDDHDHYIQSYLQERERRKLRSSREVVGLRRDGSTFPIELSISEFQGEGRIYFTGILHDITQRKIQEQEIIKSRDQLERRVLERTEQINLANLQLQEKIAANEQANAKIQLAAKVFESAGEAILITETNGNIISVNQAYLDITGFTQEEIIGKNPRVAKSGRHDKDFYKSLWEELKTKGKWKGEIWDRRKNGQIYPKWLTITEVRTPEGELKNYVGIFTDITNVKETERKLEELAYYDALTQLPNRKLFHIRLNHDVETSKRSKHSLALLFIDLDKFKHVNDTLGHGAGDDLLIQVSERLKKTIRNADTVARLGGDEFTIILTNVVKEENVSFVCENIIRSLSQPFDLSGQEASIGASIGISMFPQDGQDTETLIKHADIAMYQAKNSGRGVYKFFMPEMNALIKHLTQMEKNLRTALEEQQFRVFYQPKVDCLNREIIGMEALVRWQHPEYGVVAPNEFIPLAEDTSLIVPIGAFVLKMACLDTVRLSKNKSVPLKVAVNLSPRQFKNADELIKMIESTIRETAMDPSKLELEITESMVMGNVDQTILTLKKLRDMGVSIAMDDFGTGYSSLSYLKKLPISTLKIDRAFIRDLPESEDDAAIASAIISMAQNLNLGLVAEGIENREQLQFLQHRGCFIIQGFYYSPPLPCDQFEQFIDDWNNP
ncbi:MAG: EAL domain-containing protein [Magnetococcales bacterium]|nr:EAL domain-containing protein [Magnetococcales bacterium]